MGCATCSNNTSGGTPAGCKNNGACSTSSCGKLHVFDWLAGLEPPGGVRPFDVIEVRFKNTRKEYYRNTNNLDLRLGDAVAVEAMSGHDIGVVSLTGELVRMQLQRRRIAQDSKDIRKIYRKAGQADIEKWEAAKALEEETMLKARELALELRLEMKISDVEYQGDKTKATFYYTAEDRVDFRELIKVFADRFRVRIEMRQIGARQEAGRVGGIGSCGRELCCSTWLTDFRSVSTSAARYQQLSINPVKLAGQCGKLKCCLNFELDTYLDAMKDFPGNDQNLDTEKGRARHMKTDIFRRMMWYTYENEPEKFIPISVDRVNEIIALNKKGKKVADLKQYEEIITAPAEPDYENVVGQDDLTRFDKVKTNKRRRKKSSRSKSGNKQGGGQGGQQAKQQNQKGGQGQQQGKSQNRSGQKKRKPTQAKGKPQGEGQGGKQGGSGNNKSRSRRRPPKKRTDNS